MKQDKTGKLEEQTPKSSDAAGQEPPAKSSPEEPALADGGKLTHRYGIEDLRAIWSFVECDFERFLDLLVWLETLPEGDHKVQLVAAHSLNEARGEQDAH